MKDDSGESAQYSNQQCQNENLLRLAERYSIKRSPAAHLCSIPRADRFSLPAVPGPEDKTVKTWLTACLWSRQGLWLRKQTDGSFRTKSNLSVVNQQG